VDKETIPTRFSAQPPRIGGSFFRLVAAMQMQIAETFYLVWLVQTTVGSSEIHSGLIP
jgi:hypothetical protein